MSIRGAERAAIRPPAPRPDRRSPGYAAIGVVVLFGLGVILRVWVLASPIGAFDSDSAVPGLMARHILRGEFPVFYWGQPYGGSLEAFAAAALFLVLPPWTLLVKVVPVLFCAAATVLTVAIGRRLVGSRAAALGAAFFWVIPFGIWYSTKIGPYWASLVATLSCVLLMLQVAADERSRWWRAGLLGVSLGVAWWSNPSMLLVVVPVALCLMTRLARHWRLAWAVVAGAIAGAAPWLVFNLTHDFASLELGANQLGSTYGGRLGGFFTTALPMALGLRRVLTHEWLLGPVGLVLYGAALLGLAAFVVRAVRDRTDARGRHLLVPAAVIVTYPFLYALSPFTWYLGQPRYLIFLLPFLALVAGDAAARLRRIWAGPVVAAILAVTMIAWFPSSQPFAAGAEVPADTAAAHRLLHRQGITRAYADYWIAYRMTFESRERRIVAPVGLWRYEPYQDAVAAAPQPAYLFLRDSPVLESFLLAAAARSVPVDTDRDGAWVVAMPRAKVLPADWPEVFGCPDLCTPAWRP